MVDSARVEESLTMTEHSPQYVPNADKEVLPQDEARQIEELIGVN